MDIKKFLPRKVSDLIGYIGMALILSLAPTLQATEVVVPQHPNPQLLWNNATISGANEASFIQTMDLSGADYTTVDFQLYIASGAASAPTFDITVYTSADGGTTYASAATFTQITATSTASNVLKQSVRVAPGTKMKIIPDLQANTTMYSVKMWCVPRVAP